MFGVVVLGAFMTQLDLFIVNIAFSAIHRAFAATSSSSLSWVLNAYAIVFAACLVPAGRLADLIGRRRTFDVGIVVFAVGSAGCAAAPDIGVLVGARVVEAIGAALVIPTSLGLLLHVFAPSQRAGATGAWTSGIAVAGTVGLPLGGLLVLLSWRCIFLVNLPLAVIALVGSRRLVPEVRHPETGSRPDVLGIGLLVAGIGGLALCIVQGASWGWDSPGFVLGVLAAFATLLAFLARCRSHPAPVVELSLLRMRPFAAANAVMLCFYIAFGAVLLASVLFLTGVWHERTLTAGLQLAPGPSVVALVSPQVKRLVPRFGGRAVAIVGSLALAAGGAWWYWRLGLRVDYAGAFLPAALLWGVGVGLTQATCYAVVADVLPPRRFATGSGVLNMSRQIGLALGVAVLVAVLGGTSTVPALRYGYVVVAGVAVVAAALALALPGMAADLRPQRAGCGRAGAA